MNIKKGILLIIMGAIFLAGCNGSIKLQKQEQITAALIELAYEYRNVYEEMEDLESLDSISDMERIVNYIAQQGYAVLDEDNQLNMQNYEQVETFCTKASEGGKATTGIVVVRNNGGLHYYGLNAANGDLMVMELIVSWEDGEPVISYTNSYEAHTWKYTENGYLFFEEYYPEGYDGAPAQVGIRVKPLDKACRELNQKYVLPIGYEGNNMLITDWTERDFANIDFYDLYEYFYELKCHTKVPYEEMVTCVEYEIPETEFEEILQSYLNIETSVIKQYTDYNDITKTYRYRPRTMYDATMAYGPYPEVVAYEALSDGTIKLKVQGVWIRKMNDHVWQSELVVRPLESGGFQYVSNHVINEQKKEANWYTPRLEEDEWEDYTAQENSLVLGIESDSVVIHEETSGKEYESQTKSSAEKDFPVQRQSEFYGESGYDLPVSEQVKENAETDCLAAMELIKELYLHADKGTAANAVITRDAASQMVKKLAEKGKISMASGYNLNMENHEAADAFWLHIQNGQAGTMIVYDIHSRGGIERKEFTFDGTNMYLLGTTAVWNAKEKAAVSHTTYSRLKNWQYTEKGWFIYEYDLPEMSDRINGNDMFRVKPLDDSLREICEKYLIPIGYQGNNLLCSNWNAEDMEGLDYNGLFQYFYEIEYGVTFSIDVYKKSIQESDFAGDVYKESAQKNNFASDAYKENIWESDSISDVYKESIREGDSVSNTSQNGIPQKEFENLLMKYLPVTAEQIQAYAVYDDAAGTYVWRSLGQMSYKINFFATSIPEITSIREKVDGTVDLTVDAVCNLMGNDAVISHELTVRLTEDGGIRYLSNRILENGLDVIPEYQYRVASDTLKGIYDRKTSRET